MARLGKEEIIQIAKSKHLTLNNPSDYINLETVNLIFECDKGHTFISALKPIKYLDDFLCPICSQQKAVYTSEPPSKQGYRVVGFDQATQNFGVSVFDDGKLVYFDVIHFIGETEERLVKIAHFIDKVCKQWEPDFIMYEDIQLQQNNYGGFNTFKVLAELLGITKMKLTENKIKHECALNKVWQAKFGIAGKDRITQKNNVIKKVKEMFSVDVTDDVADAILIGQYGVMLHKKSVKLF